MAPTKKNTKAAKTQRGPEADPNGHNEHESEGDTNLGSQGAEALDVYTMVEKMRQFVSAHTARMPS